MRASLFPALLALLIGFAPPHGFSQTYTWVGKDGTVHMTDDISEVPADQRKARPDSRGIQLMPGTRPPAGSVPR